MACDDESDRPWQGGPQRGQADAAGTPVYSNTLAQREHAGTWTASSMDTTHLPLVTASYRCRSHAQAGL